MRTSPLQQPFEFDVVPDRDRVILELRGELNLAEAPALLATFDELLAAGFTQVVLDLRDVTFIDSSGLDALMTTRRSLELRHGQLSLVAGPPAVQRLFELSATDHIFAFVDATSLR